MKGPPNHVAMMQIDCEVMNTRLVYIKDDAIPIHMSAQMRNGNNNTSSSSLQRNESRNQPDRHAEQLQEHDASFKGFAEENGIYDVQSEGVAINDVDINQRLRKKNQVYRASHRRAANRVKGNDSEHGGNGKV